MLVGDYAEELEVYVPFQALTMVGFKVHAVSPGKKVGDKVKLAVHDFADGEQTYNEKVGHNFSINYDFDKVDLENYAGLFIPGGRSPEYLRLNEKVLEMVRHFMNKNLPVAAVCHGAQLLTAAGGLEGRVLTCYSACATEVKLAGGNYKEIQPDQAIVDGNLVSSPAWPGHAELLSKFIKLLGVHITFKSKKE